MRAISLWQPWASLWVSGRKVHETRHWSTDYRGWLLVHAAQKLLVNQGEVDDIAADEFGPHWGLELPRGAIVGRVKIVSVTATTDVNPWRTTDDMICGDWSPGRFAWRAENPVLFKRPIPCRGRQSFFDVAVTPEAIA